MMSFHKFIQSITLLIIFIFCTAQPANANNEVFKKTLKSTCWIIVKSTEGTFTGTGVVVDKEKKLVITNAHVVGSAKKVTVLFPQYEKDLLLAVKKKYRENIKKIGIKGRVYATNSTLDLALIALKELPKDIPAIKIADKPIQTGASVHSIGNPGVSGALWVYTSGSVRAIYQKKFRTEQAEHNFRVVETQSPINRGDSGGPVVNNNSELVALSQSLDPKARLISFCVDLTEINKFLTEERRPFPVDVEIILAKAGLKYKQNEAGPLSVDFDLNDKTKQEVFISEESEFSGKAETRRVWALAKVLPAIPSIDLTLKLLDQNSKTKLGGWTIEKNSSGQYLIIFVAKIEISASPEAIKDSMDYISRVVQRLQKEMK